jgi:HEAT repeat protein
MAADPPDHDPKEPSLMHPCLRLFALSALLAAGCDGPGDAAYKDVRPPKPPPGYHRPTPTVIDASLQAAARRELTVALRSPDELIRAHALEAIGDVGSADAGPLVLPLLADPSLLVRKAAAITAGRLKLSAAHDALVPMAQVSPAVPPDVAASDSNEPVYALQTRLAAIFALHQLGDTRFSHLLEETAMDPRPQIRGDTALILEMIGNTSAAPILVQMMKHDASENVRLQAAEALWKLGDERGEEFLIPATISGFASDKMIALLALAGPRDRRVLKNEFGMLNDDYPEVSLVAARACGQLGSDAGVGIAEIGAKAGDPMQRSLAAWALGDIGRADSQPVLKKLLADDVPDVRVTAAAAVLKIGKGG